ncbi:MULTISPECIES: hypothetical protein [Mesorhizobium]|uniref:hypothetical protein n=1 Tax=Mesorhizobium TaxID=68287 RepID=UPI000FC9BADE|nr:MULTISPECIES: hypothetical protein [Mesorhizobium]RVC49891.1 hypothetical protein EN779_28600 [Mesorhizobium sp. M4B.F.Ca.ET.088.02.2.1]MDX8433583.1 hypothetical protein [Mesorhizobium abyssinicae]RUW25740.1 hypothetical protein EOA34_10705 [Mesorhizobium sp. M4B.F.Ca.ET.013.02.1.1]RVD24316.1 hypothetical protein EN738_15400 [Mesorhizobium sp. M4B.F.Ca.ET.017.02.2.1]RVD38579.1 hypothetical protein EN741_20820 [Mesorhizobium sp. M4B.F.Ca.ET.019.03.1.1]
MKLVLSALLVVLALAQAAEAKKKVPVAKDDAKVEATRPPLDNTATGGITPAGAKPATTNQDGYNSIYPPAIYLHF